MTTLNLYGSAPGHDNAGAISAITPQPATPDPIAIETNWYGNRLAENVGFESVDLVWTALSYAEKTAVLTKFGLSYTVASAFVTVCLLRDDTWFNANATASYLRGEKRAQWRGNTGFKITINGIEAL